MPHDADPRDRLREVRARLGLTLDEAAEELGWHRQTIHEWEKKRLGVQYPEVLHARLDRVEREHENV